MLDRDADEFLLEATVLSHYIQFAQGCQQVIGVFLVRVLDAEVIHHQCESHRVALVLE